MIISNLPRERIVRSRLREVFFFAWSLVDLLLIVLASLADGGTGSPLALIFFIPVVFAAMSYPLELGRSRRRALGYRLPGACPRCWAVHRGAIRRCSR